MKLKVLKDEVGFLAIEIDGHRISNVLDLFIESNGVYKEATIKFLFHEFEHESGEKNG